MDAAARTSFLADLRAAQHAVSFGVTASRSSAADTHWQQWAHYCAQLAVDPLLQNEPDPVVLLQVYLHRYRTGVLAPSGRQVKARTAENALRSVGQTFSAMGSPDPRLASSGDMDFRITRQISYYKKQDPPPDRVKPVVPAVQVLFWIVQAAALSQ